MDENRYKVGYIDEYKKWLQDISHGIVISIPRMGREIKDVQVRQQIQTYHFQEEWDRREQEFHQKEQEFQCREQEYLRREQEFQYKSLKARTP